MGKLAPVTCETVKSEPKRARLLSDGDGDEDKDKDKDGDRLFLRIPPSGTKTKTVEYEF